MTKNTHPRQFPFFSASLIFLLFLFSCSLKPEQTGSVSFCIDADMVSHLTALKAEESDVPAAEPSAEPADTLFLTVTLHGDYEKSQTIPVVAGKSVTFDAIPVGSKVYASVQIYENAEESDGDAALYRAVSEEITVQEGDNTLNLTLSEVYTISYELNGGEWKEGFAYPRTITATEEVELPDESALTGPEKWLFAGWYISDDFSEESPLTRIEKGVMGDVKLFARWIPPHTVTFDTKGGSTVTSQTITHGKKATKPADPTKDGTATEAFVFDNWYTSADGGATLSDTAFDFDTAITEDITLYAKWEKLSRITGGISVTQDLENSDIELNMTQGADSATVTFTAPEDGDSYEWIFDEQAVSEIPEICTVSGSVLTLHTGRLVKGYYSVVLIMEKDGKTYSAFAQVHVSE